MRSQQELNSLALKTRRMLGEDGYSPIDIFALVNGWTEKKLTVVRYPLSARISGMCTKIDDDVVICINSTSSYGRQRFTLAHELYHILYEEKMDRVICGMSFEGVKSDSEREADQFASFLLMPYDALLQYGERFEQWDLNAIIQTEQFFQISHMAMLLRLKTDGFLKETAIREYEGIKVSREAARLGYGMELYLPLPQEQQYFTTGEYIRKVERLTEEELISNGKREELLLDAYRADIVYNLNEGGTELND